MLADGQVVGRILESGSRFDPPDLLWTWSITSIWPATKGVTNGTTATREEAMAKFRVAWDGKLIVRKDSASAPFPATPRHV